MISKIGSYSGYSVNGVKMITMRGRDTFGLFTGSDGAEDMRIFFVQRPNTNELKIYWQENSETGNLQYTMPQIGSMIACSHLSPLCVFAESSRSTTDDTILITDFVVFGDGSDDGLSPAAIYRHQF